eukprot:TRINITY_DN7673_c0_g1_i2.p1 TRINITY_DN7673_c0_g1~~TRINITY_DN7673_c0_g1_i2.p1  ORF type:complete len:356 (-),score=123.78 TRINITY_DN7673_c0_g1_i2:59-1087(-)
MGYQFYMEPGESPDQIQASPPEDNYIPEEKQPSPELPEKGSGSKDGSSDQHSIEKLSRSKLQYEADPEDLELRQKLLESKMARKKTEEDAKVLMNRLMLLKNEEQKAWKKIEETKKRAEEIMKMRQRNAEMQRKREERERLQEEEKKKKTETNISFKQQTKSKIELSKLKKQSINQAKANMARIEKTESLEVMEQQKQEHYLKNYTKRKDIQESEKDALERKKREIEERKEKAKAALEEKILEEQRQRLQKESELARMEQEEEELIQKLKNTQLHQQAALSDLEHALEAQSPGLSTGTSPGKKRTPKIASGKKAPPKIPKQTYPLKLIRLPFTYYMLSLIHI